MSTKATNFNINKDLTIVILYVRKAEFEPSKDCVFTLFSWCVLLRHISKTVQLLLHGLHQQQHGLFLFIQPKSHHYQPNPTRSRRGQRTATYLSTSRSFRPTQMQNIPVDQLSFRKSTCAASKSAFRRPEAACRKKKKAVSRSVWKSTWPHGIL